jgi:hypothetical protein
MQRSERKEIKADAPTINGEQIANLILAYHAQKKIEGFFCIGARTSLTMSHLEHFYNNTLKRTTDALTTEQIFELCKIIFAKNDAYGTKSHHAAIFLQINFDPYVASALHSAIAITGKLDMLADYFDLIYRNPIIAILIVDSVIFLDGMANHQLIVAAKLSDNLYSKKILDDLKLQPQISEDIADLIKITSHNPKPNLGEMKQIEQVFAADARFFIAYTLYSTGEQFEPQMYLKLLKCNNKHIIKLAEMVAKSSNPKSTIDQFIFDLYTPYAKSCYHDSSIEEKKEEKDENNKVVSNSPRLI